MPANYAADTAAILAVLDIPSEYAALGVKFPGRAAPSHSGWMPCHAIDREDSNPSAAVNVHTGRYVDFGGHGKQDIRGGQSSPLSQPSSSRSLSLWDFASTFGPYPTWQDARSAYAEKANVKLGKSKPPQDLKSSAHDPANQLDFFPADAAATEATCHQWCEHKPGVTVEACLAAGARIAIYPKRAAKTYQIKVVAFPCYGEHLANADPVGWVVFRADGRGVPVWKKDKDGGNAGNASNGGNHGNANSSSAAKSKVSYLPNGRSKTVWGSKAGLMNLRSIIRLQTAAENEIKLVFKTEGVSDMLALSAAIPPEARDLFPVVTNAGGARQHVPAEIAAAAFAGRKVVVIHDCDITGQVGSAQFCEAVAKYAAQMGG